MDVNHISKYSKKKLGFYANKMPASRVKTQFLALKVFEYLLKREYADDNSTTV
jgi:hypothetical protein